MSNTNELREHIKKTTFGPYASRLAARSANCAVDIHGKCLSGRLVKNCDQWWRVLKCITYPYRDGQWLADVELRAATETEMAEIAAFLLAKRSEQEYNIATGVADQASESVK